ncbi:MAG: CHAP domain-containing protein [Candidatus Nanopelagicales bacterium]
MGAISKVSPVGRQRSGLLAGLVAIWCAGLLGLSGPAWGSDPATRAAQVQPVAAATPQPVEALKIKTPARFDATTKVGTVKLGASKNATIKRWGVPTDISKNGDYTQLTYGGGLIVRADAKRIIGFDIASSTLRAKKGVRVGSSLAKWRKAYRKMYQGADGTWLLSRKGNLTALSVRGDTVTGLSMVWRGAVTSGGGGTTNAGRGSGSNPFAAGDKDHPPCLNNGTAGWCWCTWWAHEKRGDIYPQSAGHNGVPYTGWDAKYWLDYARRGGGFATGTIPVVGAIAVWTAGKYGHVAYVEEVYDVDGSFKVSEYNRNNNGKGPTTRIVSAWEIGGVGIGFIYGGPASGAEYIGHIVHRDGDTEPQRTAWLVINRAGHPRRTWIPNTSIYYCLKNTGAPGPDELSGEKLTNQLPVLVGEQAACAGGIGGGGTPAPDPSAPAPDPSVPAPGPSTPAPAPSTPAPPPAPTWSEQQGSRGANTFTNPFNASGMGQAIAANQWVQVSCKVYAPQIASANPDGNWYRIASAPWNNAYYAVANTFWNGDIPGQLPYVHNTDLNVPNC